MLRACVLLSVPAAAALQLVVPVRPRRCEAPAMSLDGLSRRGLLQAGVAVASSSSFARAAQAEEADFSRMGGLLEPFIDVQKGYKFYSPSGWNKFDADPGVYDVKFQDVINQFETVTVATSPVSTATSITALGDLDAVGAKFAKSRSAKLVSAKQRDVDGSLVYVLELEGDEFHELLALCINRGKLYRVNTVSTNKRWSKRSELYKNVVNSFVPKGF